MIKILYVAANADRFAVIDAIVSSRLNRAATWVGSGAGALTAAAQWSPAWAIIDELLPDMTGLALVGRLLSVDAWINTALVSSLPFGAFHEATEGLGIAVHLPPEPGRREASRLLARMAPPLSPG
jgi:hypothetical protein